MKTIGKTLLVLLTLFLVYCGIVGYEQYVRQSRRDEMLTPQSRKAALKDAEADALREITTGNYKPNSEASERAYRLKKAVEEDELKAESAQADAKVAAQRVENAKAAEAKRQAEAKAIADAPRLRAEAEEAKRRAALREIGKKYSGQGK